MKIYPSAEDQIDDAAVRRYFNATREGGTAISISMMAHEHNLPLRAAQFRRHKEIETIADWLDAVPEPQRVLDVGCGAGAWAETFGKRYSAVVGIEQSPLMVMAARERVAALPNVKILGGDVRTDLPEGPFDLIFVGGLCMYLNDADVVALLRSLRGRLSKRGSILLRESTVPKARSMARGEYQAVYRSVTLYHDLFDDAGRFASEVRRNYGYTNLVTGEELVDLRRKWLPFLPKDSALLGSMTWWFLRGTAPMSFWALPRVLSRLNLAWPRLQNHFFMLRLVG
jgi:SAM-dependent methyltransferase